MRGRGNRAVAMVLAVVLAMVPALAGCTQTVGGSAQSAAPGGPSDERSYGYADNRCGLLEDSTVAQTLGADNVVRPYSGAVCQYVLDREKDVVDVVFAWFDSGSLDRERALAGERGAQITDTVIERHKAFLARRDGIGVACSATAAGGGGVLSWWVQYRHRNNADPCPDAEKLLSATLKSDL
ncbi:DUF3558 domain-containing protein [Mycobacterium hackensackense]|uniref:DUF3558 domain-containing protein n=1 Tax=Mycobacterium hackensackense TaxID=228909 RepID=UPI002265BEA4|nr:DUF3558 domain-containing protein [Mycobacterium hackensackense]MCV7255992.1 DUF3558 domain-containing protein [Mycobacterium hackensackense]